MKPLVGNASADSGMPNENRGVELTVIGPNSEQDEELPKPKVPSKDSPIRWLSFLLFIVMISLFVIILIILVAID